MKSTSPLPFGGAGDVREYLEAVVAGLKVLYWALKVLFLIILFVL